MSIHKTIYAQYKRDSSNLCDIIDRAAEGFDVQKDFKDFYDNFWNIETATGVWLDIWGVIVAVDRYLELDANDEFFGFKEGNLKPFNDGVFYSGSTNTNTFALSDDIFRRVLIAKAMANIASCDAGSLNAILTYFFKDRGKAYVTQPENMVMNYIFEFQLEPWERALFVQHKVFPRPAGVLINAIELPSELWGFNEAFDYQTFNNGIFYTG